MDRNIFPVADDRVAIVSPPARVAWIETLKTVIAVCTYMVATREGGVDRNYNVKNAVYDRDEVATREGGVDRNFAVLIEQLKMA